MRRKLFGMGMVWRLLIALILALCLVPVCSHPAAALSVEDYFEISYEPVEFSKTAIQGNEVFYATIGAEATCIQDLPLPVSEAQINGCVIAEHQVSGARVTLNSSYTVTIEPFPNIAGETSQSSVVVSLRFPGGSESGTYDVSGELVKAEVQTLGVWVDVTSYLPPSQAMGSVTYVVPSGGGGGIIVGPDSDLSDYVDEDGEFTQDVTAKSEDGKVKLFIEEGTIGLTEDGEPLSEISIIEMEDPPDAPEAANVIGLVYHFGPDRATFDPPITLTFTYDESEIPEGVAEEDLIIAIWDEEAEEWVNLVGVVDPETNTITAEISHFTLFTILAYTCPAAFVVSELSITPAAVDIGQEVTISVLITNTGDLAGSYEVILKIDNVVEETKEVTLARGTSQRVTFTTAKDAAGTYVVTIVGLSGTFVVGVPAAFVVSELSITPAAVDIGEEVTISVLITNTGGFAGNYKVTLKIDTIVVATKEITLAAGASDTVTFRISEDAADIYLVNIGGLSSSFEVKPAPTPAPTPTDTPPPAKPINWTVLSGVLAAVVVVGLLIFFLVRRKSHK